MQPNELAAVLQQAAAFYLEEKPENVENKTSLNTYNPAETLPSLNAIDAAKKYAY